MKSVMNFVPNRLLNFGIVLLVAGLFTAPSARGGLTIDVHLYHNSYGYYFYPDLSTNTTTPDFPTGVYRIASWQYPTNGSANFYHTSGSGFSFGDGNGNYGSGHYYLNFDSLLYGITNGPWSILVTNSTSTNLYQFMVSVTGLTSNIFGAAPMPVFPTNGAMSVTNQPLFTWTGPTNWAGTLTVEVESVDAGGNYYYVDSASLAPDSTTWMASTTLPDGTNSFSVDYISNVTALITASIPTNDAAQPIAGWISTATLESQFFNNLNNVLFTVGQQPATGGGGHTNVAYYSFEDGNLFSHDFSGNGNDIVGYGHSVPGEDPYLTNDVAAGSYAVGFTGTGWQSPPTNLVAVLGSSFSVSIWVRTSEVSGNDSDTADFGAGILAANPDQVIPMALTGSKLAFLTGGAIPDTLHSTTSINTGNYVHLVVTRDAATGEKKIYINGALDASDVGATGFLNTASAPTLYLGMNSTFSAGFVGDLDEVQIYSGVLSAAEVMQLYQNPGTTIPDVAASSGNGVSAHYDFDEGTVLAPDVSGNGNDMVYAGNFGGSGPSISTNAIAGAGSVSFTGGSYLTAPSNLLSALQGSFSVSLWIKTTQNSVSDQSYFDAAGIVAADVPGEYNDLVPVGMNQYGHVVFNTGNPNQGYDDEMYSAATVNDGFWHHIVVTRDQTTGEKYIYIDGILDGSSPQPGTTSLLNAPVLLTIGALADASNPDPTSPSYTGDNGYDGLVDDIQIYPRVLTPGEVTYLYDNPGAVVTSQTNDVSIAFELDIVRNQDPTAGDEYYCFPYINSVSPTPITTDEVHSPNDLFSCDQNGSSSSTELSLGDVLSECTNGLWTLYVNRNDPSEQDFTFQVSIAGLTTNLLKPVIILSPTNGSGGVSTTPTYDWTGPDGYDGIFAQLRHTNNVVTSDSLPGTATNWVYSTPLNTGTNTFYLNYSLANVTNFSFTTPVDNSSTPLFSWMAQGGLDSEATSQFVVSSNAPVQLVSVQTSGGNLQFSFQTQNGLTNTIEVTTNLVNGIWIPLTNFVGDGTLKQFTFPMTNAPVEFFHVTTQ